MKTTITKLLCSGGVLLILMQAWQPALAAGDGVKYRIAWDATDSRYHVFLQPTSTPLPDESYSGATVTVRVPHLTGADRFAFTDNSIQSVDKTTWTVEEVRAEEDDGSCSSTRECQVDNADFDYLTFIMDIRQLNVFALQSMQEVEAFSFAAASGCLSGVEVMPDDDLFNVMAELNSRNVANFFINKGWRRNANDPMWTSNENHYLGSYGGAVNCSEDPDGSADDDSDGLTNAEEGTLGTDPKKADSDNDGLSDREEVKVTKTDPLKADTDGDGKNDKTEVGSDLNNPQDTDKDTKIDALESSILDADNDGVVNERDAEDGNPNNDSDGDGYGNMEEKVAGTDPLDPASKPSTSTDDDADGLTNTEEGTLGTDPKKADTDGDGEDDGAEVGADINNPKDTDGDEKIDALESSILDADNDGVVNERDAKDGDPNNDSDGDGYGNMEEKVAGTDPLDPASKPSTPPQPTHIAVPTLTQWAQIALALLLGGVAALRVSRANKRDS